jgi:hypothetical protein
MKAPASTVAIVRRDDLSTRIVTEEGSDSGSLALPQADPGVSLCELQYFVHPIRGVMKAWESNPLASLIVWVLPKGTAASNHQSVKGLARTLSPCVATRLTPRYVAGETMARFGR